MAIEKKWPAIGPLPLVRQGTTNGILYLSDVTGFHVGQMIQLNDPYIPGDLSLQIKRIIGILSLDFSDFPYLEVGPVGGLSYVRTDVSAYSVTSSVFSPEQPRPPFPLQELDRATYNDEPAVAKRTVRVDPQGNYIDANNPSAVALFGTQITILNNLLTMQIQSQGMSPVITPSTYLINNEGFFVFDNEGNFIEAD